MAGNLLRSTGVVKTVLNMAMMSKAKKTKAHLVKLNEPVLDENEVHEGDMAK